LDIGVLGYIVIVWPKEHSPEVRSFPPGTPCISDYLKTEVRNQSLNKLRNKQTNKTNKHVGFAVNFKAYIWEVIGWHLGRNTGQCELPLGFSWSLHANAEELSSTVELYLSGCWISGPPVIRIGLVLLVNLLRILHNYLTWKLPVICSSTVQCYGF